MARAHDLMSRLVAFGNGLSREIEDAGGLLAVGLYAPRQDVGDLSGRFRQALESRPPWARRVFPGRLSERPEFADQLDSVLAAVGYVNPNEVDGSENAKPKLHLKANFFASGPAWELMMHRPELADLLLLHAEYLARQGMISDRSGDDEDSRRPLDDLPDVRAAPEGLMDAWVTIIRSMLAEATPEQREKIAYYFTVGSVNLDYRSMVLNAETMIVVTRWQALSGFIDFLMLPGLCEWVETQEEIDALLPPPSGLRRTISNFIRILL
jgi:hypothetical protein